MTIKDLQLYKENNKYYLKAILLYEDKKRISYNYNSQDKISNHQSYKCKYREHI